MPKFELMRSVVFAFGLVLLSGQLSAGTMEDCKQAMSDSGEMPDDCKDIYNPRSDVGDLKGMSLDDGSGVAADLGEDGQTGSVQFVKPLLAHKFTATVTAPVDKKSKDATFVGVGGVTAGASLKLEYAYVNWPEFIGYKKYLNSRPGSFEGGAEVHDDKYRKALECNGSAHLLLEEEVQQQLRSMGYWSDGLEAVHARLGKMKLPTQQQIIDHMEAFRPDQSPLARTDEEEASDLLVGTILAQVEPILDSVCDALSKEFSPMVAGIGAPELYSQRVLTRLDLSGQRFVPVFSSNASVGRSKFDYLDVVSIQSGDTPSKVSSTEIPWSIGFRAGWLIFSESPESKGEESLVFSIDRQRGYDNADAVSLCKPVSGFESVTSIESCEEIALGDPNPVDSTLYVVEYRALWEKLGIAFRVFYQGIDDKPDDYGVEVPIFFISNSKEGGEKGFQGGLKLGFRDQDDDGFVSVFVGKKFSIF